MCHCETSTHASLTSYIHNGKTSTCLNFAFWKKLSLTKKKERIKQVLAWWKPNKWEVGMVALWASTAISGVLFFQHLLCGWQLGMCHPAWMGLLKTRGPWRIETRGHEFHSRPHKDEPHVSAPFENRQRTEAAKYHKTSRCRGNLMPIDFNASSARNHFLQHNGWRGGKRAWFRSD